MHLLGPCSPPLCRLSQGVLFPSLAVQLGLCYVLHREQTLHEWWKACALVIYIWIQWPGCHKFSHIPWVVGFVDSPGLSSPATETEFRVGLRKISALSFTSEDDWIEFVSARAPEGWDGDGRRNANATIVLRYLNLDIGEVGIAGMSDSDVLHLSL